MDVVPAKLIENAFGIIGPGRGGILLQVVYRKFLPPGKGGRGQFDFAVGSWRGRHENVLVHRQCENEALIVIRMIAQQLQAAWRAHDVRGMKPKLLFEESSDLSGSHENLE